MYKKIILTIIFAMIFSLTLLINKSQAFTGIDGHSYPNYSTLEGYQTAYTYNTTTLVLTAYTIPDTCYIGYYYNLNNNHTSLYFRSSTNTSISTSYCYSTVINGQTNTWTANSNVSTVEFDANTKLVGKTSRLYPFYAYRNILITELPEGVSWDDNIMLLNWNAVIYCAVTPSGANWYDVNNNKKSLVCRANATSANISFSRYIWDDTAKTWSITSPTTNTPSYIEDHIAVFANVYNTDGSISITNQSNFFFQITEQELYRIPIVAEVEQIPTMMATLVVKIIPLGLIIFGMGLLIYLIRSVISRLA